VALILLVRLSVRTGTRNQPSIALHCIAADPSYHCHIVDAVYNCSNAGYLPLQLSQDDGMRDTRNLNSSTRALYKSPNSYHPPQQLLQRIVCPRLHQVLPILNVSKRQPTVSTRRNLGLININKDSRVTLGSSAYVYPISHSAN
jgi:hypothetical protein